MHGPTQVPFEAYDGDEPYIFVSYSHEDMAEVYEDLKHLHTQQYRIWYDEGIEPTEAFPARLQRAIEQCAFAIAFLSPRAVASDWVLGEVNFALDQQKQFLAVHLRETRLVAGLAVRLGVKQALLKYQFTPDEYLRRLRRTLPDPLREAPEVVATPEASFRREVEKTVARGSEYSTESLLELGVLLGVEKERAKAVLAEMGVTPAAREKEEQFRRLVQLLVKHGPIDEDTRSTLASRAQGLGLPLRRAEAIVQEEALQTARDWAASGRIAEARDLVVSSVGRVLPDG
jgi:hypothetical protein